MTEIANEKRIENPSPEQELLARLERETNICKRQELLKAVWRLGKGHCSEKPQSRHRHESPTDGLCDA